MPNLENAALKALPSHGNGRSNFKPTVRMRRFQMRYLFEVKISSAGSSRQQFAGKVQHDRSFACR
jgi:hypothetical protein